MWDIAVVVVVDMTTRTSLGGGWPKCSSVVASSGPEEPTATGRCGDSPIDGEMPPPPPPPPPPTLLVLDPPVLMPNAALFPSDAEGIIISPPGRGGWPLPPGGVVVLVLLMVENIAQRRSPSSALQGRYQSVSGFDGL